MKKRISLIVNVIELYCIARREIKSSPVTAGNVFDEFFEAGNLYRPGEIIYNVN